MARRRPVDLLSRDFFDRPSPEVACDLLGRVLEHQSAEGLVAVRLTEAEAYAGEEDPASHAFRGRTARNATMYGDAGHAYVYFTYGMHYCINLVCLGPGTASAVLLRAGEVVEGADLARARRRRAGDRDLARGPARLCGALGVGRHHDGADVCDPAGPLRVLEGVPADPALVRTSPRTGVVGAKERPWRFYVGGEPYVSPYRPHTPRRRRS
ncbi:MAG: DNA-3-methyladenine glycosylase [Streptosporangiales bacterium]|nr:DNA-3-methyladenine glycosylase [Streptosporangiales bacterium]